MQSDKWSPSHIWQSPSRCVCAQRRCDRRRPKFIQETQEHDRVHDCGSSPNTPVSACSYPHKNENSRGGGHSLISCWLVSKALLARLVDTLNVQCSCFKKRFINNLRKCTDLILIDIFCVQDVVWPGFIYKKRKYSLHRFFRNKGLNSEFFRFHFNRLWFGGRRRKGKSR